MKIQIPVFIFSLLIICYTATAQNEPSAEAETLFSKAMSQINAKHVGWVKSTAKEANQKSLATDDVMAKVRTYGALGNLSNSDIEALCFLVLMQASKSAKEDLKAIMARVKSINEQKQQQREMLAKMKQQRTMTKLQLDSFQLLKNKTFALQKNQNPDTVKLIKSADQKVQISKTDLDAKAVQMKNDLDSMSEMGEMESLRLQMAMDRKSKMTSTLSNLLKKISKTQEEIIKNLK